MTAQAEHTPPEGIDWGQIIASIEAMEPADAMAMTPGSGTEKLVADFPELGRVVVTDVAIDGPGGPVPARAYRAPAASGTGLAAASLRQVSSEWSARIGSSIQCGRQRARSAMRAGACSGDHAWLASVMMTASSPSASRIDSRLARSSSLSKPTFSLKAR